MGRALYQLTGVVLCRTWFGLRLRACGEDPIAAESLGVNVYRLKTIAVTISGALAGLGGAVLVLVFASIYREGQTAGRGFIGLAAMRSEEHTSELQSLMRSSYAVFCLKKQK